MAETTGEISLSHGTVARLDDVTFSYGDLTVLEDLSVEIPSDAVTALIGPNGSGKTTLARVLAGILPLDSGARRVESEAERPVGYLPQQPRFRAGFTIEETLTFYTDLLETEPDLETAMAEVGLESVSHRRVDELSGGMRRLLGVAQSLLGDPPLIILDEPTSDLDPRMQQHVFDVTTAVADGETGVLLTTHDLANAKRADNLLLLNHGQVIANQPPEAFLEETGTDSLREAFLAAVGRDPGVQAGVEGETI